MMTDMNPTGDVTCNHLVLRSESPSCLFTGVDRNALILSALFVALFLLVMIIVWIMRINLRLAGTLCNPSNATLHDSTV